MAYCSRMPGDKRWNKSGVTAAARRGLPEKFEVMQGDKKPDEIQFGEFVAAAYKCLADDAFLILFASGNAMDRWKPLIEATRFAIRDTLVWSKGCANGGDLGWSFIRTAEFIICCSKGKPTTHPLLNAKGIIKNRIPGVLNYGRTPKTEYVGHPTQKPLFLCSQLVRAFSDLGELVVDPFCGSGSILVAADYLGRQTMGCDIDRKFVSITQQRLADRDLVIRQPNGQPVPRIRIRG